MADKPNIDPVKVRETSRQMAEESARILKGTRGATALLWFDEFAVDKGSTSRQGQVNVDAIEARAMARLVASATPGADVAQEYLTRAALTFRQAILERAIEFARADFLAGEVRKGGAHD